MEADADGGGFSQHYVLINAHPAFAEAESIVGMVNEPAARDTPTLKMIESSVCFLADDDPLMKQHGLTQPEGAEAGWRKHVHRQLQMGSVAAVETQWRYSERMVLLKTTRGSYSLEQEFTVDYGESYVRSYACGSRGSRHGSRRPTRPLYAIPREAIDASAPAMWPNLPGWFNPKRQPKQRPAFEEIPPRRGVGGHCVRVVPDDPELVAACRAALEAGEEAVLWRPSAQVRGEGPPSPPPVVVPAVEEVTARDLHLPLLDLMARVLRAGPHRTARTW